MISFLKLDHLDLLLFGNSQKLYFNYFLLFLVRTFLKAIKSRWLEIEIIIYYYKTLHTQKDNTITIPSVVLNTKIVLCSWCSLSSGQKSKSRTITSYPVCFHVCFHFCLHLCLNVCLYVCHIYLISAELSCRLNTGERVKQSSPCIN